MNTHESCQQGEDVPQLPASNDKTENGKENDGKYEDGKSQFSTDLSPPDPMATASHGTSNEPCSNETVSQSTKSTSSLNSPTDPMAKVGHGNEPCSSETVSQSTTSISSTDPMATASHSNHLCSSETLSQSTTSTYSSCLERYGLHGLVNLGNTCFMNAALQCLSNTKDLRKYFIGVNGGKPAYCKNESERLAPIFSKLLHSMWNSRITLAVNPEKMKEAIGTLAPRFKGHSQQDSQEFLTFLLEGLHEDLIKQRQDDDFSSNISEMDPSEQAWREYTEDNSSLIVDLFQGQLKSLLRCSYCQESQMSFDPFMFLTVPLPNKREPNPSIKRCLELLTEEKKSEEKNWLCPECKTTVELSKKICFSRLPPILIVYLKRFSMSTTFGILHRCKLDTLIDFDMTLDLSKFISDGPCTSYPQYNLYAVINHHGSLNGGHYTAYAKHDGKWFLFDDERVTESEVKRKGAYVLFYEQCTGTDDTSSPVSQKNAKGEEEEAHSPYPCGLPIPLPQSSPTPPPGDKLEENVPNEDH